MSKILLNIDHIVKKYHRNNSETLALDKVSIQVPEGAVYGIIGKNGAGKSTLFRCLTGAEKIDSGTVSLREEWIPYADKTKLREIRKKFGVVFQKLHLFTSKTVEENLSYPLEIFRVPAKERNQRVEEILELLNLKDKGKKYPGQLSGGEQQRVAIGRAIINEPEILLCDEATSALDTKSADAIFEILRSLNDRYGLTILIIAHHREIIEKLCTHVAYLENGAVINDGPIEWLHRASRKDETLDQEGFLKYFTGGYRDVI